MEEIENFGIKKIVNIDIFITKENIQQMDYLNYVLKEALRLDGPAYESLNYIAYEDTTIWGVPLPKNTILRTDFTCRHLNSRDWQEPMKFIPERFDPTSNFFASPSLEDKPRTPFSLIPFSHGMRNCPGQTFALLQTKVILLYLLTQTSFTLDHSIMQKDSMGFNLISNFDLPFTITKPYSQSSI